MNAGMSDRHATRGARVGGPRGPLAAIVRFVANVLSVALIIGLTYYLTMFFAHRPPPPAPSDEAAKAAIKARDELRAEERRLLSTYGEVNSATRTLRIPIDRAMDIIAAENARPAQAPAAAPAPAPKPEAVAAKVETGAPKPEAAAPKAEAAAPAGPTAPAPAVATLPPPGAARGGLTPEQLYRAVCQACHDVDGRGSIVRKTMPVIPDFTDAKWQLSRTDLDLQHSVSEGKGQLMLSMKDKFALAKIEPREMVAFIRAFAPTVAGATTPTLPATPTPSATPTAVAATTTPPPTPTVPAPPPPPPVASVPTTAPTTAPTPPATPAAATPAAPGGLTPEQAAILAKLTAPPPPPPPVNPPPSTGSSAAAKPVAPPSPARLARLRAAGEFFQLNCLACHGPDGRGTVVRLAMPPLPDFTVKDWQLSHSNAQLKISILEGKGTFMPPWRGKVTPELAGDLVAYIRGFGPAGLVAAESSPNDFDDRFRALQREWDVLEEQVKSLTRR